MPAPFGTLGDHRVDTPLDDYLGVANRSYRGNYHHPGFHKAIHRVPARGLGERRHRYFGGNKVVDPPVEVTSVGLRFTPNEASVAERTSATAATISSKPRVAAARIPNPPAAEVAAVSRGPATQPMPVWTTGWRTPTRSQKRVWSLGSLSGR